MNMKVKIFADGADKAGRVVPYTTQAPVGSTDPLDLYAWLENYEKSTGGTALALAHNGNLSNGIMFPVDAQYTGKAIDPVYTRLRAKWEPMYEITQIKGDGEAHPKLSPDDEFADYGTWDKGNLNLSVAKTDDMLQYEYAREALKNGLAMDAKLGTNPYKFGMAGSSDTHTGLAAMEEENYIGKHSGTEPDPERMEHIVIKFGENAILAGEEVASGYTGVWATENTRKAIWDAMARKEVYATTGPRMLVRFFGGWQFTEADAMSRLPADAGYAKGVPMGSDLPPKPDDAAAPTFLVAALKDPYSGNLDRVQIVKGWLDKDGKTQEKVYDVVWGDAESRTPGADGKLPAVGDTVDLSIPSWTNTIGAPELGAAWTDPDFDPTLRAFYYARVIEIPTPRWTAYDRVKFNLDLPKTIPLKTQERAYTSPIWYTPKS